VGDTVRMVLGGLLVLVFGLSRLARRFPHVAWLQVFRDAFPRPSEARRTRMRRADAYAGAEMILMGIALPLLYVAATVMFFNSFTARAIGFVLAISLLCIGLGVTAIWRSRRG